MKRANKNNLWAYITILIVAIIMCVPLMQKGIQASHDGDFHISRAIGTIEQLEKGERPFVVARFSNELGFGWNLFYPPINTAINVIFAVLTGNAIFAMKLFIFFTFFLSGITMYQFVLEISKNKVAAIFSSLLYMIAPYRLLNVYTRLAVGEMVSFIFIPMIFRGVYLIFKEKTDKEHRGNISCRISGAFFHYGTSYASNDMAESSASCTDDQFWPGRSSPCRMGRFLPGETK